MNNEITIEPASEALSTIKIGIRGPSGSGKTYSALLLAYGLVNDWSKILVVDTERSVGLYKSLGNFSKISLTPPYSTERFLQAFRKGVEAGFKVIIFDSISHWWSGSGGVLEANSFIEENFCKGNSFKAWLKTNKELYMPFLQETILQDGAHVIFTLRTKVKYVVQSENGKQKIQKMGTKEDMRDGFDYELSIVFDIDQFHVATPVKDRTSLFDGNRFIITEKTGEEIKEWLSAFSLSQDNAQAKENTQDEVAELIAKIEYYLPAIERFNPKIFARLNEVIRQKDKEALLKAIEFIHQKNNEIESVVTKMVKEIIEKSKGMCEEEKSCIKKNSPPIFKNNPYFHLI